MKRQRLEHVGRAGEVVAVPGVEWALLRAFACSRGKCLQRRAQLLVGSRIFGKRDACGGCFPGLVQAAHAGRRSRGMSKNPSAAGVDQIHRAERLVGVRSLAAQTGPKKTPA